MISLILQPQGSALCGQCCVAMAAGVPLEAAIAAVGHAKPRGTKTRELVAALRKLGVPAAERLKRTRKDLPVPPCPRAILRTERTVARRWHWLLHWDGLTYDPAGRYPEYDGWRITSYLELC